MAQVTMTDAEMVDICEQVLREPGSGKVRMEAVRLRRRILAEQATAEAPEELPDIYSTPNPGGTPRALGLVQTSTTDLTCSRCGSTMHLARDCDRG